MEKDLVSKVVDGLFSIKRRTLYLIIILLFGFVLRLIAANNLRVYADDMHFVTHAINFISSNKLVTYDQSSGLWFQFTDLMYNIFGISQVTSRMAALLFGTMTILVIYLFTKEFFSENVALISALLLSIAPFHIRNTSAEMDVMTMFFVLMGMLLFVRAIKKEKVGLFLMGGIFIGLAVYTKVYPLLFIPSLLIFFIYSKKKLKEKIITKKNLKLIVIFLFSIFMFTVPAITHNYLLYKDKGFLDLQFTRVLGLGKDVSAQYYSWDSQFEAKNSWKGLIFGDTKHVASGEPLLLTAINFIRIGDPVSFYLGLIGVVLILFRRKKDNNYLLFTLLSVLFVLPFLASIILLSKHYIFLEIFLIPLGAVSIDSFSTKINKGGSQKYTKYLVILLIFSSIILLGITNNGRQSYFYGKSDVAQIIEFKNEKIPESSIIIVDGRIYRGRTNWIGVGRPYLEAADFIQFLNKQEELPGEKSTLDIYYIECAFDDCGWGTVKDQPGLNESMESLTNFFKQNGQVVGRISEPNGQENYFPGSANKINTINIYNAKLNVKSVLFSVASQPKEWFLYTIGYNPVYDQFDYYEVHGWSDRLLEMVAHAVARLALILSLASLVYLVILIRR